MAFCFRSAKAFSLCGTLDDALALREEIAFFQAIKAVIAKATTSEKRLSEDQKNAVLKQILDNAVVAEGVTDVFALAGLDKPNIGILDDAFLTQVRNLPERNLAVELLERLLQGEIKSRFASNVVQNRKFSDLLGDVIKRYQNRKLYDTHQSCYVTLEEISQMIKNGDDLRVIDNKTKNDITQATLTQLLYETERKTTNPVPVELLKEIIRKGDGSFSGFIRTNMKGDVSRFESEAPTSRAVSSELAEAITQ